MTELLLGISLGWAAGIAPGPLLTLVITTTMQRGVAAGIRVAMAPLLTDAPIIVLSVALASELSPPFVAAISVVGGSYLVWLGLSELRSARYASLQRPTEPALWSQDVRRGVLTNVLSPHPWLFWATVGGPILVTAWRRLPAAGIGFLVGFYALLIGVKVVLAVVTGRGRGLLSDRWYRRLVATGGAIIAVMGVALIWTAVRG